MVLPCYNEEAILYGSTEELNKIFQGLVDVGKIDSRSFFAFVDDGSADCTWEMIEEVSAKHQFARGLKLSRNCGHQYAILAGMHYFNREADCIITMDADLQDDTSKIEAMVAKYTEGNDIVYGVKKERKSDGFIKRLTAFGFYQLMMKMGVEIVFNHADCRLASKRVIDELRNFKEVNLFLRGMFPLLGFRSTTVEYDLGDRAAGETKFSMRKMLSFAIEGITSFSTVPLRVVTFVGMFMSLMSVPFILYTFYSYLVLNAVPGWGSTMLLIYFVGGIQLFCIGVIGEYLGKIYKEVKQRPPYIIEKTV